MFTGVWCGWGGIGTVPAYRLCTMSDTDNNTITCPASGSLGRQCPSLVGPERRAGLQRTEKKMKVLIAKGLMTVGGTTVDSHWTDETSSSRYGIGTIEIGDQDYGPADVVPGDSLG